MLQDYDSLYYRKYTAKSEFDKAIHTLEGILKGISIDNKVDIEELQELDNWCSLHREFIHKHPFSEIIPLIQESISDNNLMQDEIEDILWVCNNLKTDSKYYDIITSDIQRLEGILHGILADNQITESEVLALSKWLDNNKHLTNIYPYDEVYSLVTSIISDNIISNDELKMLKVFFSEFIDIKNSYNINNKEIEGLKNEIKIEGICAVCPEIIIKQRLFCFTGKSSRTSRNKIKDIIESFGGYFNNNIVKDTNYLVVGNNGNPCWAFSCYGRKVEKAVQLRKEGIPILIVHENDFWDVIEDLM